MRTGAFLMIDALGFKGIWRRPGLENQPELVIQKLANLQRQVGQYLDQQFGGPEMRGRMEQDQWSSFDLVQARFLSDTIVLAVAIKDFTRSFLNDTPAAGEPFYTMATKGLAVHVACSLASAMLAAAAKSDPALAYRGCISCGDFEVHDNFLVGPAVDEAAAAIDLAQGAFVWLLPSALDVFMGFAERAHSRAQDGPTLPYLPFNVPLKGGDEFSTYAVSPCALAGSSRDRDEIRSRIMDTFIGGLDVQIKKQNTLRFMDACADVWKLPVAQAGKGA